MDLVINAVSVVFLAALAFYVASLGISLTRRTALADSTAALQRDHLRARIAQIADRRQFERERSELSWNGFRKFEVRQRVDEARDICSFYLQPHDRKALPPFEPGQFLTFQLQIPGQNKAVVRCYSLSDSPNHPDYYRVTIKRVPPPRDRPELPPGLSSNYFHDALKEGDILDVKAPSGHFFLDTAKQTPVVLIGGGVGLTPVLSMLNWIVESGSKRETHFFYGVTNSGDHTMKAHLERIGRENENVHLHICYSQPLESDVVGEDFQHEGRVSIDLFKQALPNNNFDYYLCGPPPMMTAVVEALEGWGVPEKNIHFEAFGPASVKKKKQDAAQAAVVAQPAGSTFEVTFSRSGKSLPWPADAGSILEFAEDNGIHIDSGCRAGNCGTCITAIKSGDIVYVNEPGSPPEAGSCLACISIPKGNLVIDA
jgi:ferredoxin-NADP reductase